MKNKLLLAFVIFHFTFSANGQWTYVNTNLCNTGVFSLAFIDSNIIVGNNIGICLSTNNGSSWVPVTCCAFALVPALLVSGTNIFAGSAPNGIFLSADSGSTWLPINSGLTDTNVYSLAVNGANIFAGTENGGVFLSTNNGASWTAVNSGLTNLYITAIAIEGTNIYAGTNGGGVFLSTNNGSSWNAVNTGLPAGIWVHAISISGTSIFAGTDNGIYLSTNNGSNWTAINTGLTNTNIFSLLIIGSNIFAGSGGGGVFQSTNNGTSWTDINTGFPSFGIAFSLAANSTNIYVTMYSDGVYTRPLSQITGINDASTENVVSIFPNPSNNELTIQNNTSQQFQFILYNSIGEKIVDKNLVDKTSTINISAYSKGIYFYRLSNSMQLLMSEKLIIQ